MDSWKKYIQENEDKLSIEEVDDKVWQQVSKAGVPKKSFIEQWKMALDKWFQQYWTKKEGHTTTRGNHKFKLAFASVFVAFLIVSCTYKVKSYTTSGDLVSFALSKNSYLLNNETLSKNIFYSFSRVISPSDSSFFLFFKYLNKNNPEAKTIIGNIKETKGISELTITPVVIEYKESLLSSWVSKAFHIELKEAKPDTKQIKHIVKSLLKGKGVHSVEVQVEENGQEIRLISTPENWQESLPMATDAATLTNAIADSVQVTSKTDTTKPKQVLQNVHIDRPNQNKSGWKQQLALTTELIKALNKEGLVDDKKAFKLEIKDGEFYINDIKQSKNITDKFRKYFRDDNYTINNEPDESTSTSDNKDKSEKKSKSDLFYPNTNIPKFDGVQYAKDLKLMNQLIDGLHEDGLIDRKKPYTVQVKEGELYIDDKKQPKEVSDKFRKFFQSNNYGFTND